MEGEEVVDADAWRLTPRRWPLPPALFPTRILWMMIQGLPWTPADQQHFPPAFRAAARTLLLAHRRGSPTPRGGGGGQCAAPARLAPELQPNWLSLVPLEFVMAVIERMAWPLDPWFAPDPAASTWVAAEFSKSLLLEAFLPVNLA